MKTLTRIALFNTLLALAAPAQQPGDPYATLLGYTWGAPRAGVMAIEAEIRSANPGQLAAIEARLLKVLQSPEATSDAKSWICRTLRIAGSEQAVPALAPLLRDKTLASDAQYALRCLRGPKVDEALRNALAETQGLLKVGVLHVLGARGDRAAVPLIAPLAGDSDAAVAGAAFHALGHIGGEAALQAAQAAKAGDALKRHRQHAILLAAESLLAEGKTARAAAACDALYREGGEGIIKCGALRGLLLADKAQAAPVLAAALTDSDPSLRAGAARLLGELADAGLLADALAKFASYPPDVQMVLLSTVNHAAALPVAQTAASSQAGDVRVAALGALGRLGNASVVPMLVKAAVTDKEAAGKSLLMLRGAGVTDALVAAAQSGEPAARAEAIRALAGRNATGSFPALLKLAADAEPVVRAASLRALGSLSDAKDLPALVELVVQGKTDRDAAASAIAAVAVRVGDKDAASAPVLAALPNQPADARAALLRVLAQVPTARSLEALRAAVKDADPAVQDAAIRGMANWPDAAPMADLKEIAASAASATHRALALRGFVRMAGLSGSRAPDRAARSLAEAMEMAKSPADKKLVLAALSGLSHAAALELAVSCLPDKALEVEAATAVVGIAKRLQASDPDAAKAAVQKIRDVCTQPAARRLAESRDLLLAGMVNIAPQGTASSPDDLEKDGSADGDQAAIDGNPNTYWDERNGAKLYRLVVSFKQPQKVAAISVVGYRHHDYAPKDFEVLCDGKPVSNVVNAQYTDNFLVVRFDETACQTVELKITGCHGHSPGIRELGIYRRKPQPGR